MKIAIFDSGIGGLSVLNEALRRFSGVEFLYFADTKNVPYGVKKREDIVKFSLEATKFLISQGAGAVVVACNTATSAAINELRANFSVPIIGMEPAIKRAIDKFSGNPTLIIATPVTIEGEKLKALICKMDGNGLVKTLALPNLVNFAQNQEFEGEKVKEYLRSELAEFDLNELSSLVLGCTHFNYFKDTLRELIPPHVALLDGIEGTINRLISELGGVSKFANGENIVRYFYSGEEAGSDEVAKLQGYLARLEKMREIS